MQHQTQGPVDVYSAYSPHAKHQAFPLKAWPSRPSSAEQPQRPHTASGQRSAAQDHGLSTGDESSSPLDAETRYLPLSELSNSPAKPFHIDHSTARPRTAPPASEQAHSPHDGADGQRHHERSSSHDSPGSGSLSKYEMLENRPIKPMQTRKSANYPPVSPKISPKAGSEAIGRPTPSDLNPQPHQRKRSASPVTRAITFTEDSDSDVKSQTAADLKAIKLLMASTKKTSSSKNKSNKQIEAQHGSVTTPAHRSPQQYTPEKYSTPTRKSLHSHAAYHSSDSHMKEFPTAGTGIPPGANLGPSNGQQHVAYSQDNSRDKPDAQQHSCIEHPFDVSDKRGQAEQTAAVRVQALWRGYHTRQHNAQALRVRLELRSRRAEDHIRVLRAEVQRQKQLYEKEKSLRLIQLETLRYLVKEVQSLQHWKGEILNELERSGALPTDRQVLDGGMQPSAHFLTQSSHELALSFHRASLHQEEGFSLTPKKSELSPHPTLSSPLLNASSQQASQSVRASAKEIELEHICRSLQKQVGELQQVLTSMSNYVFQGGVISADKEGTAEGDDVKLSMEFDAEKGQKPAPPPPAQPPPPPVSGAFKSSQSITLSSPTRKLPAAGIPTAPANLRMQEHGVNSVILQWDASLIYSQDGDASDQPLQGYRILVNGSPKGMVAGTQTRALLEGLQSKIMYRMTVKAVSDLGESGHSNMVVLHADPESSEGAACHPRGEDSDQDHGGGGGVGNSGSHPGAGGGGSNSSGPAHRRRSSAGSGGSPSAGNGSYGAQAPADDDAQSHGSTQAAYVKNKSAMHVQFDLSLPSPTDNGYHPSPSPKDKYSKTFPPTHQLEGDADRKGKRPTVIEQLKISKNLSLSRENSSESLTAKSEDSLLPSSPRKDFQKLAPDIDYGRMTKEEIVRVAIDKGWISTDDILRMAMKMSKRKANADIQTPLKAFSSDDMQKLDDSLNDSGSSFRKDASSKIPVYKGKAFESSNESLDMPSVKDKLHEGGKVPVNELRTEPPAKRVQRRSSQKKGDDRPQRANRKHLDSSGSESCSPQVSPCNTSSGMSLSGTTGSESSGAENAKKRSPEVAEKHARTRPSGLETDVAKVKKEKDTFAAARRISLTRPNPPPIPPPSERVVRSSSFTKQEPDEQSENDTSTTLTLSQSQSQDTSDHKLLKSSEIQSHSIENRSVKMNAPPPVARRSQQKEKGYAPSFHDSHKVILRREGSFDSVGSDSHPSSPLGLRKVGSAPGIIASSDERCQKIVQSDGSVVYKSYRKVSIDTMSDHSDADLSREIMNETFTVELPGTLPDDEAASQEKVADAPPPAISNTTIIDNAVENSGDETDLKLILDSEKNEESFRRGRRGRASHRSPRRRSKERVKEKRSLSVGAVMRKLNQRKASIEKAEREPKEVVKNKPPKPPTGRSPSTGRSPVREDTEFKKPTRRRTVSEQGTLQCTSDSDDAIAATHQRPPKHRSKSRERSAASRERSSERHRSTERESRSRDRSSERSSESRERQSEVSSEGELGASQRSERSSPSPRRKTFIKHQRSGSDLSNIVALPDRPESPSPRRPAPPSTPKKALNSPRVRRSSSFSRPGEGANQQSSPQKAHSNKSTVRQCISLETLKAVKSQSQEMMSREGREEGEANDMSDAPSDTEDDDPTPTMRHKHRSLSSEGVNEAGQGEEEEAGERDAGRASQRSSPMRRSGSLRDDRLLYMSRYKNEFRSDDESGPSTPRMGLWECQDGIGYSPRLSGRRDEEPKQQRRIKLGTKAADLFAKLQMKLSNGKSRDADPAGGS